MASDRLTEAQRNMLAWLSQTDLEVPIPTVADRLVDMGFATCLRDSQNGETFYRITDEGRAALSREAGDE